MMARLVRWDGDGLNDQVSQATGLSCKDPSLTKQADKEAADINNILKRYEKTGSLPDMIARDPQWGDFADVPSFQEAFEIVAKAEEQFAALDAPIRKRFANDPAEFLAFVNDPRNEAEMRELGILKPKEAPPSQPPLPEAAKAAPASK